MRRALTVLLVSATLAYSAHAQEVGSVVKLSKSNAGVPSNSDSTRCSMNADGGIIAFESTATNLIPGLNTWYSEIYYYDRNTGLIGLAHVDSNGNHGGSPGAIEPAVSGDGGSIAFRSGANNLIVGDLNNTFDIFLRDIVNGTTERVSLGNGGVEPNGPSWDPALSFDGRYVVFESEATNLDPSDTLTNTDVYWRDRVSGITTRVTVDAFGNGGGEDPAISADGRYVAFHTNYPMLPGDTNGFQDVYVRDMVTGTLVAASLSITGAFGNRDSVIPSISADGSKVAFSSRSSDLVSGADGTYYQILVKDMTTGAIQLASVSPSGLAANGDCYFAALSADGQHVAFNSQGSNLAPNDLPTNRDVFVRDLVLGQTVPISVNEGGVLGDNQSQVPCISADGQLVAYDSYSTNILPEDTVGYRDIFLSTRVAQPTYRSFCHTGSSISCPCGNGGLRGRGCGHSASTQGAILRARGTVSVLNDTVTLEAINVIPGSSALLFQGNMRQNAGQGTSFGDGLRCAAGSVARLAIRTASANGVVQLGHAVPGDASVSVLGAIGAGGAVRTYQAWYRDSLAYCTPALFNTTNGIEIAWTP